MHRKYVTVLLMTAIYLAFLVTTAVTFDWNHLPPITLRTLLKGEFPQQFEEQLSDQIGFHDSLFRLKTQSGLLIGEQKIRNVYVAEDMLLEKITENPRTNLAASAEAINTFYQQHPIPTCLLLIPSAAEIYESRLPANAVKENQSRRIQEVYGNLIPEIRTVDACHILTSLSDAYIYYRTDRHWTSYGAYHVYQAAIKKMGFTPIPYQRYVISHVNTDFRGDLYEQTLFDVVPSDVLDHYHYEKGCQVTEVTAYDSAGNAFPRPLTLYDTNMLASEEKYRFYLGSPCEKLVIRTNLQNEKRLLVYKDDFADCFIPFLAEHYSEICVIDLELTGMAFEQYVQPEEYTQVLFLCSMKRWEAFWEE